ncbi:MAG: CoA-binding protein [Deltaproteobacteria bacterium]|nr:CoA-binding protein [Deltaproteobacteria bacterium]
MSDTILQELHPLFYPKNIAVVGASPKYDPQMMSQGNNYIKGSIEQNFPGKIFPVHPKAESILGFKAYARVRDIPDPVDLVIFTVPAEAAMEVMEDCVQKKVKFVHLYTAGFAESGRAEYIELEKKLVRMAQENGVRIVGPNCMGIYSPEGGLAFQPIFPTASGPLGFFSQSGQMAGMFVMKSAGLGLTFSKVISFGNARDLKAIDFLNYLSDDDKTKIMGSYIEGLQEGHTFMEMAGKITRKKPLVIYKGGLTEGGTRAVMSHTASIAGSAQLWQAMCKQYGIISVASLDELAYTLSALQRIALPKGKNVVILGGAGGGSVTMTDIAESEGLKVPHLSEKTIKRLQEIVPPQGTSVKNPLDVGRRFFAGGNFQEFLELIREDPNTDALIFTQPIAMFQRFSGREGINMLKEMTIAAQKVFQKPIFLVIERDDGFGGQNFVQEAIEGYHAANLATFPDFRLATRVLNYMADYQAFLEGGVRA